MVFNTSSSTPRTPPQRPPHLLKSTISTPYRLQPRSTSQSRSPNDRLRGFPTASSPLTPPSAYTTSPSSMAHGSSSSSIATRGIPSPQSVTDTVRKRQHCNNDNVESGSPQRPSKKLRKASFSSSAASNKPTSTTSLLPSFFSHPSSTTASQSTLKLASSTSKSTDTVHLMSNRRYSRSDETLANLSGMDNGELDALRNRLAKNWVKGPLPGVYVWNGAGTTIKGLKEKASGGIESMDWERGRGYVDEDETALFSARPPSPSMSATDVGSEWDMCVDDESTVKATSTRRMSISSETTTTPKFEFKEPVIRNGSRQLRQTADEVPYPLCYDEVLLQEDDKTYELVKALIPTTNRLTFHDFVKPPTNVLDIGCGEGRWIVEAAGKWKHTRFHGLDVMDHQMDLSTKGFEDVRDRIHWVHGNFVNYPLPFEASQFDFIRMSHIALAVPQNKWKPLLYEIRRVLKPNGVLEWIDEDIILPFSPLSTTDLHDEQLIHDLEREFGDMLKSRGLDVKAKALQTVQGVLGARAFRMGKRNVKHIELGLPSPPPLPPSAKPSGNSKMEGESSPSSAVKSSTLRKRKHGDGHSFQEDEKALPAIPPQHHTPRGLMVFPERKLLPLNPVDLEAQAMRNFNVLLGSAGSLWSERLGCDPSADREVFDQEIWDYERNRHARLFLNPNVTSTWDDEISSTSNNNSNSIPSLAVRNQRRRSPFSNAIPMSPPLVGEKPTIVRSLFVLTCVSD